MPFTSILFGEEAHGKSAERTDQPEIFVDLHLDQIVAAVISGKEEYDIAPLYFTETQTPESITYRHEVMRDLDDPALQGHIQSFTQEMRRTRELLALSEKLSYNLQKQRWFLDAVAVYCDAVRQVERGLSAAAPRSRGLLAFRAFLTEYLRSDAFTGLQREIDAIHENLAQVRYSVLVRGQKVTVRKFADEPDYTEDVQDTFAKFRQGAVEDYRAKFEDWKEMNHVEARILDGVATLFPDVFATLASFRDEHASFMHELIQRFDREIQFYLSYLSCIEPCKRAGLMFCYPELADDRGDVSCTGGFDLSLALKASKDGNGAVVRNDFRLEGNERVLVVSGPNQGGKTTFARMFAQVHYLARLGLPVPAEAARLFRYDEMFTHFERPENLEDLRGKLQDDLIRIRSILDRATEKSIIVMNEIFSSTTLADAVFLGKRVMEELLEIGAIGVCVTFIDELASLSDRTVSMVSTVVPDNPAERTYKVVRHRADGLAYALSIAEKYDLTYERLKERLKS